MAYSLSISYTHVLTHERKVSAMLFITAVFTFLCKFKSISRDNTCRMWRLPNGSKEKVADRRFLKLQLG